MKKLIYYPNIHQTYPFSLDWFANAEKEAQRRASKKRESKTKFRLAFGQ